MDRLLIPTALVCALTAGLVFLVHLGSIRAERQAGSVRHLNTLAAMGALAVDDAFETAPGTAAVEAFRTWAWRVIADPVVVGAALVDGAGAIVAFEPEDVRTAYDVGGMIRQNVTALGHRSASKKVDLVWARSSSDLNVILLASPLDGAALPGASTWPFGAAVVVILFVAGWYLRNTFAREIQRPVSQLIAGTNRWWDAGATQLPTQRNDEFGLLARNLGAMIAEHREQRGRLGQIKRTMDVRIAAQTKQIQGMLNRAAKQAWIDPLTKLGNRRLLDDKLEELFDNQTRAGEDMSIILFDLDNFKTLNDRRGHAAGDELLQFFGELLGASLRTSDVGIRTGGDEFAIILLGSGSEAAAETAHRITKMFAQRAALANTTPPVTTSAGVASIVTHKPGSGAALLALADAAMYYAKGTGKGHVSIYSVSKTTPRQLLRR